MTSKKQSDLITSRIIILLFFLLGIFIARNISSSPKGWKIYNNPTYGFRLAYPSDGYLTEEHGVDYDKVSFFGGCFSAAIFSKEISQASINWLGISKEQAEELITLPVGKSKVYSFHFFDGGTAIYKVNYNKLDDKLIKGHRWSVFELTNNFEQHGAIVKYLTKENGTFYVITLSCQDMPVSAKIAEGVELLKR